MCGASLPACGHFDDTTLQMTELGDLHDDGVISSRHLPRYTTPTWEMELLISGATVFALLQLPEVIDRGYFSWAARLSQEWQTLLSLGYAYLKAANFILIGTFILHLALRAYWVAIVGLSSVYPGGIRWDKLKLGGPIQQERMQANTADIATLIERADNRSSLVFGVGIGMAGVMLFPLLMLLPPLFIALAVCSLSGQWQLFDPVFYGLMMLILFPFLLGIVLDRRFGARVARDGRMARALRAVFGFYQRIGMGSGFNTPTLLFLSQMGRSGTWVLQATIVPVVVLVMLQATWRSGGMQLDSYGALPANAPGATGMILDDHYASRRGKDSRTVPFVDSLVARGPYLELFLPYDPTRDAYAIEHDCIDVAAPGSVDEEARGVGILACLGAVHPVSLDGRLLDGLQYEFAEDPESGLRGRLAMIDVRSLPVGRHELQIARVPLKGAKPDAKVPNPYRIPFWR